MSAVTRNLRIFITERKPKDIGEMSMFAERYLEVHGNTYNFANVDKHRQNLVGQQHSKYPDRSNVGLDRRTSHKEDTPSVVKVDTKSTYHRYTRHVICATRSAILREIVGWSKSSASHSSVKVMHASVKSDECLTLAHERVSDDQRVTFDNGSRWVQNTPVANMPVVEGTMWANRECERFERHGLFRGNH